MVTTAYMLDQPRRTDALKRFIDQQLLPTAIDAAAAAESIFENVAVRVSKRPVLSLSVVVACGTITFLLVQATRRAAAGEAYRTS